MKQFDFSACMSCKSCMPTLVFSSEMTNLSFDSRVKQSNHIWTKHVRRSVATVTKWLQSYFGSVPLYTCWRVGFKDRISEQGGFITSLSGNEGGERTGGWNTKGAGWPGIEPRTSASVPHTDLFPLYSCFDLSKQEIITHLTWDFLGQTWQKRSYFENVKRLY